MATEESTLAPPDDSLLFDPAKASNDFRLVADWLAQRTLKEKLCFWAALVLIDGDIQNNIKRRNGYPGYVADDVFRAWDRELLQVIGDPAPDTTLDAESQKVLSYIAGLQTGQP